MSSARILIIEDEPVLLRVLKDTLVSNGFNVTTAAEGATGLKMAVDQNPDLILLDIMLPKVNGYEICRSLRERA